ncbi:hypothetical protein NL676_003594 [Syzygium grande]|nr:hypothetical protein NL676_003594 [Syzygium grande]
MALRSGAALLVQQYGALFRKNLLLSWRNKRATFLHLFSSFFFIFLIFCIQEAIDARIAPVHLLQERARPGAPGVPAHPALRGQVLRQVPLPRLRLERQRQRAPSRPSWPAFGTTTPAGPFLRASTTMPALRRRRQSPVLRISHGLAVVLSFGTAEEVDAWLYSNPMRCPGALHFTELNSSVIRYGIQSNSTPVTKRGQFEDPTFKFQIPLQIAAEREIARSLIGDSKFSWVVGLKEFAHPAIEIFSAVATVGPAFFLAVAMFSFVLQISSLITEKELKLRQSMTVMGLYDTAYWLSWLTWEGIIAILSSLFIVVFGMMFQFDFFLNNSFPVVFLLFFLFQLNMIGFAFMLSAFISKASSSTTVGFSIFIIGFLTQASYPNHPIFCLSLCYGFPYSQIFGNGFRAIWSLFPPNLLAEALKVLSQATSTPDDPGISWSRRAKCAPKDTECVISINDIYIWLVATFFVWFILAIYFDNIIPNASGVRKPIFYFLNPGYWTGKGGSQKGGICSCIGSVPPLGHVTPDDEDVLQEESIVKAQAKEGLVDPNVAVQIRGLGKTYPGTTQLGCCKCKRTSTYHAIKELWVNFAKDQLFCLLGPNGAGKTTTINCLTGITPVTGGDALVYGYSIRNSIGMSNIRKIIGVCFDILWDLLTGEEHLYLFTNIKGLAPASIKSVVEKSLAEVRLTEGGKVRAGSYSGGMKRRLSVAIALIGDPKLVVLDEPTTGMDPITRRHVWDIIEDAKKGRAIILTTHSMEEADILSDRIGIMAKGRLRSIGTSIRLKSRFGTGFIANVSFAASNGASPPGGDVVSKADQEAVKRFFKTHLDIVPKEENKAFLTFVIPHDREALLTKFFAELQDKQEEFGIADIQLGRLVTLTLTSGTSVQIPVGAQFVGIPGTESAENSRGVMVEVYWQQDDSGALCISGHSSEMPIPPSVQLPATLAANMRHSFLGRTWVQFMGLFWTLIK